MGTTTSTLSPDSETRENGELFAALQNELSAHIEYLGQQQSYDLLKTQDFLAKSIASNGKFADDAWVFVENYSSEILKQQTEEKEATKRKTKNTTTADFLRSFQLQNNVLDRNDGDDGDRNFDDDDDEEEDYNSDEEEEEELDLHNFPKLKDFEIIEEHIKNTECDEDYDLTEEFARLQNIRISSMNRSNNDPHHHHHDDHNHHNDNDTHPDHGDNEDNNHSNSHHTDDWIVVEDDPFKMALRKIEEFKAQKLAKQQQPPLPPPQNSSTAPSSVLPAMIINSYSPSPITSPRENIVDDDINSGAVRDDKNDGNDQLHSPPPPPLIISSSSASRSSSLSSDKETIKQLQEQITMLVIKIEQIEKRNNNFTHALLHRLGFDLSSSLLSPPPQLVNNTTTTNNDNADNEDDKNEDEEKEGDIENVHKSNYHEVHVHSIVNNIESLINNNQITVNNNLHQIPINKPEPTTQHHHLMPPLLPSPSSSPPCSSPPPPPPPPSLEQLNQPFKKRTHHHQSKNKSKEEIQNLLTIEIEQSEISDKNKKIALNNYLKCFSSPSAFQFLDFMVTYYSPLIRALPLQPKTAFELIKVWESHLFTQIEDINQRNSLRKRKMTEICLKREHDEVIEEIEKIKKFIELQKKEDEEKKRRDNLKKHFMNDLIEKLNQLNQLRADNNEDSKLELEQLEECVIDEHEIIPFTPDA